MERMVATSIVTQGSHKQQEELIINERNQHSTIEEKRSEEIAATTTGEIAATTTGEIAATTRGSTQILVTTGPTQLGATLDKLSRLIVSVGNNTIYFE